MSLHQSEQTDPFACLINGTHDSKHLTNTHSLVRHLANSSIMYESTPLKKEYAPPSLLRLNWNKKDPNYVAAIQQDHNGIIILDVRVPAVPVIHLNKNGHGGSVSAISWAPHSSAHLLSSGTHTLS